LAKAQKEYNQHQQNFVKANSNTWAAVMVQNQSQYFTNALASPEEQECKMHF
jgi:hypothetical protein